MQQISAMMDTFVQITTLNDFAATLILQEQYQAATPHLISALRTANDLLTSIKEQQELPGSSNVILTTTGHMSKQKKFIQLKIAEAKKPNHETKLNQNSGMAIFENPALVTCYSQEDMNDTFLSKESISMVSLVILFNLGLCFQLLALQDATHEAQRLNKALHLYQQATFLLQNRPNSVSASDEILLYSMLFNNMACLHIHLFRWSDASDCVLKLSKVLEEDGVDLVRLSFFEAYTNCQLTLMMWSNIVSSCAAAA